MSCQGFDFPRCERVDFLYSQTSSNIALQVRKWLAMGKSISDCPQKDVRSLQIMVLEVKMLLAFPCGRGCCVGWFSFLRVGWAVIGNYCHSACIIDVDTKIIKVFVVALFWAMLHHFRCHFSETRNCPECHAIVHISHSECVLTALCRDCRDELVAG